jgi:hypothetical protein
MLGNPPTDQKLLNRAWFIESQYRERLDSSADVDDDRGRKQWEVV